MKLDRRSTVVNQGRLASLGPIRKCLIPTHERKLEMATGGERSAGMQNGQRGKTRMHEMNMYANAMHEMTWYEMHENENNTRRQRPEPEK